MLQDIHTGPTTIHFLGFIANVDSSILSVRLVDDFMVDSMSDTEASEIISHLEKLPLEDGHRQLLWDNQCINRKEDRSYAVTGTFQVEDEMGSQLFESVKEFNYSRVQDTLEPMFRLMRLHTNGNVCLPLKYFYLLDENGTPTPCGWGGKMHQVVPEPFTLEHHQLREIEEFIREHKLPFKDPSVKSAFDHFELSYHADTKRQAFSLLLGAMEDLYYPEDKRLTDIHYQISRNAGILLGETAEKARNIQKDVESLFRKRGEVARSGGHDKLTRLDIIKCRTYVRETIKKLLRLGLGREEFMDKLVSRGFRDRLRDASH